MIEDKNLMGAIVYYDRQMNDTRMCLHLALTATQQGACVASRVSVLSLLHDSETGRLNGAVVRDSVTNETFTIKARAIVNAAGAFADAVRQMDDPETKSIIKGAAGVHVVLPDHYSPTKMGLIIPKTSDGRVLFFLVRATSFILCCLFWRWTCSWSILRSSFTDLSRIPLPALGRWNHRWYD